MYGVSLSFVCILALGFVMLALDKLTLDLDKLTLDHADHASDTCDIMKMSDTIRYTQILPYTYII